MKNETLTTIEEGSYKATVTFIKEDGYGNPCYRVKVTYNNGDNLAFLGEYKTRPMAEKRAIKQLEKLTK